MRQIAAFDFDGTLTYRDTLLPFLFFVAGPWKLFLALPCLIMTLFHHDRRKLAKERLLRAFFDGMPLEKVRQYGEAFAREKLPSLLRPEAIAALHWHQQQGHTIYLVSANLDVYLEPWGKSMGFAGVICSRVGVGKLVGANCWGEEKVRRLKEILGDRSLYTLYAYGDSRGDYPLLKYADHPVLVTKEYLFNKRL